MGGPGGALQAQVAGGHGHVVEFYDDEAFLVETLTAFLEPALRDCGSAIVVATAAHRRSVELALGEAGIDISAAVRNGRYHALDARAVLSRFMVDGAPDATRFRDVINAVMDRAASAGDGVRVFGEMVALLWDDGDAASAVALEDLWNAHAEERRFALLCAYPMRAFAGKGSSVMFRRICEQHTRVIPTESYTLVADPAERSRAVAQLQQRAAVLSAELQEREGDQRFRLMVEGVQDYAIFMLDVDGNIATWNAGAERVKGYRSDQIIGRHFSLFYPPEDARSGKPEHQLVVAAAEGRVEDEGWRVRRDGDRFWAHVVITALRDADGTLRGYGKITRDLTARRSAELDLRASEERFRWSFDGARTGMMIIDLEGRYERVNQAFCALVGYSREELCGRMAHSITHPDDVAADAAELRSLLDGYAASSVSERRYLHAAGHPVWTATNLTLILGPDGQALHFIAQVQDITERRRRERRLQHMADHDPLTGQLNRRSFERELSTHCSRVRSNGPTGAVLMVDLDHFKDFNDTYGHSAGDRLIARTARQLRSQLRAGDTLARIGGDEFAILLAGSDGRSAEGVAEALLRAVCHADMPAPAGHTRAVTASVGIAHFDDCASADPAEMMVHADRAMYDAKRAGRNRWVSYHGRNDNRQPARQEQPRRTRGNDDAGIP